MKSNRNRGFTLIELMVALVVAGLLMGVLVGLSGAVQRSFGFSKEVTELQANLRFAMRTLVDDFSRTAFMVSPDANVDILHRPNNSAVACPPYPPDLKAVEYDSATGTITLRGNFVSARDYSRNMFTGQIACRNEYPYNPADPPALKCGGYEPYHRPFADGPAEIGDVFCPGQWVRMDASGDGRYCYFQVNSVGVGSNDIQFSQPVNRDEIKGMYRWVNPITLVRYQLAQGLYTPRYASGTDARFRWVIERSYEGCRNAQLTLNQPVEIAEFILPQAMGGFVVEQIMDTEGNANLLGNEWQPTIGSIEPLASPVDPVRLRGLVITLRGRVENEDPEFKMQGFTNTDPFLNFGVDLDGEPDSGLARVRVERTVVDLRNMAL